MKSNKSYLFFTFLASLPVLLYFFILFFYKENIPHWDDYDTVLFYILEFNEKVGFFEKIKQLFKQANEHIIFTNYVVSLLIYGVFGKVNFLLINFAGQLMLLLTTIILYFSFRKDFGFKEKIFLFCAVPFLLFNIKAWDNFLWAITPLQHYGVTAFAFLTIYFVQKRGTTSLLLACAMAFFTVFSNGNGLLIVVVGLFVILLTDRSLFKISIWITWSLFLLYIYFSGFQFATNYKISPFTFLLKEPLQVALFYFNFTGSALNIGRFGHLFATLVGFILFLSTLFLLFKWQFLKNITLTSYLLFIVLTGSLTAFVRSPEFGAEGAFAPRYAFYSPLYICIIYLFYIDIYFENLKFKFKYSIIYIFLVASVAFNIKIYKNTNHYIIINMDGIRYGMALYNETKSPIFLSYPDEQRAIMILQKSAEKGIYNCNLTFEDIPARISYEDYSKLIPAKFKYEIKSFEQRKNCIVLNAWALVPSKDVDMGTASIYLRVKSAQKTTFFETYRYRLETLNEQLSKELGLNIYKEVSLGFTTTILNSQLAEGIYDIDLIIHHEKDKFFEKLPYQLTKKGESLLLQKIE